MEPIERGHNRGNPIYFSESLKEWVYDADGVPVYQDPFRDCGHCGEPSTPEGHDACLGTLAGVMNACCGHGHIAEAYVQFDDGTIVRGKEALERAKERQ